jgi:chromate transport protein ChrA
MEHAYYVSAFPHMVALSFMHIHHLERSWHLEAQQKATIAMIGLTLGRFVMILLFGEMVEKLDKTIQRNIKHGLAALALGLCVILMHANRDHYNAWWFLMALFWGIHDGVYDNDYYQLGDELPAEEKQQLKNNYTAIMVISSFVIYILSIPLYNKTPIWLLLFMIVALILSVIFSFEGGFLKFKKTTEETGSSSKMLIVPDDKVEKKNDELTAQPPASASVEPAPETAKVEEPPKSSEKAPEVAEVKLD